MEIGRPHYALQLAKTSALCVYLSAFILLRWPISFEKLQLTADYEVNFFTDVLNMTLSRYH